MLVTAEIEPGVRDHLLAHLGGQLEVYWRANVAPGELHRLLPQVNILLIWGRRSDFKGLDLRSMENLEMVQALLAGVETLPYHDIPPRAIVCSGSGALTPSVVEHALALILSAAKHTVDHTNAMRQGKFPQARPSKLLHGGTLLVVGVGDIGGEVARVGKALGMHVVGVRRSGGSHPYCDRLLPPEKLTEGLRIADAVVLTLPLTTATRGIIGEEELGAMKPDAILVNVGRGKLIQEEALYDHLRRNPAFAAALDVWWEYPEEEEGYAFHRPFQELPNVVMTPHVGGSVPDFRGIMARHAVDNIARYLEGREPRGIVRREDYLPTGTRNH